MSTPSTSSASSTPHTYHAYKDSKDWTSAVIAIVVAAKLLTATLLLIIAIRRKHNLSLNVFFFTALQIITITEGVITGPFAIAGVAFERSPGGTGFCFFQAYVLTIGLVMSIYCLMAINVDHFMYMRTGEKQDENNSRRRTVFWLLTTLFGTVAFSSPPLLGHGKISWDPHVRVCFIDWQEQPAYYITAGIMVTSLPVIVSFITSCYLFTPAYKVAKQAIEKGVYDRQDRIHNYRVNIICLLVTGVMWVPFTSRILMYQMAGNQDPNTELVPWSFRFLAAWLGMGASPTVSLINLVCIKECRQGLLKLKLKTPKVQALRENGGKGAKDGCRVAFPHTAPTVASRNFRSLTSAGTPERRLK